MESRSVEKQLASFHEGANSRAYELYGCHADEDGCCTFRVWAPHASKVSVVLSGPEAIPQEMQRMQDGQSYELALTGLEPGFKYCYEICTEDGRTLHKADPYGYMQDCKTGLSVFCGMPQLGGYLPGAACDAATDAGNGATAATVAGNGPTAATVAGNRPVNIFEVNLFSWARNGDGSYLSVDRLISRLVPYVARMGYTHVEFMPVTEYPFDGSWGYQVTGYFAGTRRLGRPEDLRRLVEAFHEKGIGVIMDWVPAHFPKDAYGLYEFDGQPLYESALWDRMEMPGWGTRRFAFERPEVVSFLLSSARFLVEAFHADGLRIDAVASMLFLDYDRKPGDYTPNELGDNRNLEGIAFLQKLNAMLHAEYPGIMTVAEDSSAYPGVTKPVSEGGLGFDFKWDLGWMNDTLFYMRQDPYFRCWHHGKLTFSMMYAFNERYILPLSHDEVVHAKGSIINKMPGPYEDKFAGERLLLGYMYAHPGKKLNFMGYDIAQFDEWNYNGHIQYKELGRYDLHRRMQSFVKKLNSLYREHPALHEEDSWAGYEWLVVDDKTNDVLVFMRTAPRAGEQIICVCSFCGADLKGYRFGVPSGDSGGNNAGGDGDKGQASSRQASSWQVVMNTDAKAWGGRDVLRKRVFRAENVGSHGKERSICMDIPKLSCIYLKKI